MLRQGFGRARIWLGIVQVALLLVTMVMPAAAAPPQPTLTDSQLIELLRAYSIVRGDDSGNLNLNKPITRAEMITIAVRAMGGEEDAQLFSMLSPFGDAKGHWAEHNITYGYVKKLIQGDGNGLVRPNAPISYAEALTLILRLVGQEPTIGDWPTNVILAAAELRIVPPGVTMGNIREAAIRGEIFRSLAQAITTVKTPQGKTFLQAYVDSTPPALTIDSITTPTKDDAVTVQGVARDAVSVWVNGSTATMSGNRFTAKVSLTIGDNGITVEAVDRAGNVATSELTVARLSPVAQLVVTGPTTLKAGETGTYTVSALDSTGKSVPAQDLTAKVSGNIGNYDAKTGVLTAGATTAKGSITFSAGSVTKKVDIEILGPAANVAGVRISQVNGGISVPVSRPMTVEVKAVDVDGRLVAADNGREITLEASGTGVTVMQPKVKTVDGVATFTVVGTAAGQVTLTAKSANISSSIILASFGTSTRVVLRTDYSTVYSSGTPNSARITAELRDESGNLTVNNTGSDIIFTLTQTGTLGDLPASVLTIPRGLATSTSVGTYIARSTPGQVIIGGAMNSGHQYSIDPVTVWVTSPVVNAGSKLQILNVNPVLTPRGPAASLQVRVVDGNGIVITTGSYAFRVQVDTSNGEPKTNGLPSGVTLTLGGTAFSPVDTGVAPTGNYVYGRTVNGTATLNLSYDKSGVVTLTPVLIGPVSAAYSSDGIVAATDGSASLASSAERVLFSGSPSGLRLTVDSALGRDQSSGSVAATSGAYFTLRATVLDQFGGRVPGATNPITIAVENPGNAAADNTTPPQFPNDTRNAVDGVTEFVVYSKTVVGCDTYVVSISGGTVKSLPVQLCVHQGVPADPRIITARGTSGTNNRVRTTDTGMEIELAWATTGADTWVNAIVYQNGGEIYTSEAFNMSGAAPRIVVPRSALASGQHTYSVALRNAAGISNRSASSAQVTVDYETGSYGFANAKYDAGASGGHKLTVFAYGVATSAGVIDPSRLVLKDASSGANINLQGATWTIPGNGQFVIDLNSAPDKLALVESPLFSGRDVTLEASAGWYYQTNGATGAAVAAVSVTPLADITSVTFDVVNNRLTITGQGFETGTIDLAKLSIRQGNNSLELNNTNVSTWGRISDSVLSVTLSPDGATALKNPSLFNGSDVMTAAEGWLYESTFRARAIPTGNQASIPVSAQVTVSSISYTKRSGNNPAQLVILGSGFFSGGTAATKGTVDLSKLSIKDLSLNQNEYLSGTGAQVDIVSDGEIVVTIDGTDAELFEATFAGTDIYVIGETSWFKDFQNRNAGAIQERYFRLTIN